MKRRILWMNLLFGAGLALLLPWLAAGLLAHLGGRAHGTPWATHHAYAVRTFWIGAMGLLGGVAAVAVGAMEPILAIAWLWCAARVARQFLAWEREEWITDPGRFL